MIRVCSIFVSLILIGTLPAAQPIDVKVLVLNFDPIVKEQDGQRLHAVCGWTDPKKLAEGYVGDLERATGGLINHTIVEWKDIDDIPVKADGFQYSTEEWLRCHKAGKGWHQPDAVDYNRVIAEYECAERVSKGEIDEVWLFGPPYAGFWESAMAGPRAFYINGGPIKGVTSKRPFAVMGFNYERGVAEMLHSLCHRVEATMSHFSGGWKSEQLTSDWARFAANAKQSGGEAGVGSCHYPANGEKDYDYDNKRVVMSTADDWLHYPNLTGKKKPVNCETWGGPDYHRNYMRWWYERLPRAEGVHPTTKMQNNWWKYVYQFDQYSKK